MFRGQLSVEAVSRGRGSLAPIGFDKKVTAAIATYRSAILIYNPCAGRLRGAGRNLVPALVTALSEAGHCVRPVATSAPGHASRIAREAAEAGADLVIGLGGDGTLNDLLNGVAHTAVPIAMLPAGTANVLTRELGLGTDPMQVAGVLGDLVPERVAAGLLHAAGDPPRYFMLMAGIGFDGHIVYNLNLPLKARLGQAAYWLSAFKELVRRLDEFDVEVDGRTYRCTFALASRVRNYAGWMRIAQTTSLWDREFEIVLFQGTSPVRHYLRHFARVVTARVAGAKGISCMRASRVSFSAPSGSSIYVQVDGEFAGRLPARVEIVPNAVTILVPRSAVESETALNRRDRRDRRDDSPFLCVLRDLCGEPVFQEP